MALQISKIEAVKFGDFELIPDIDKEQRLRVKNLEIHQDDYDEAIDILSRCFGSKNTEKVRKFMSKHMFYLDFVRLQTYLLQGESGLESLNENMDKLMAERMKEAAKQVNLEAENEQ